jgi:diguanylate cyclase (GGDEF)-like protein
MSNRNDNSAGADVRRLLLESLRRPWGPLRFPGRVERIFREHHRQQWLTQTRTSMLVGIVLFAGYSVIDGLLFPEQAPTLWQFRLAVAVPVGLLMFAYTYLARTDTQIQLTYSAFLVLGGCSMAALTTYVPTDGAHLYASGIILVIAFSYIVSTLRLWYATTTGLLISMGYLAVLIFLREVDSKVLIAAMADLASINLIGFYAALVIEVYTRHDFARITLTELDRRQLADDNLELMDQSQRDALTDLANRRALDRFFNNAWHGASLHSLPVSALMIDLDHFKRFNDEHGHQAGDECLKQVAKAIQNLVREPTDLVARYGGEEFVVVLTGTEAMAATTIAERIRETIEALEISVPDGEEPLHITTSVGVSTHWPAAGGHPAQLVRAADQALYQAKRGGRNRVWATDE